MGRENLRIYYTFLLIICFSILVACDGNESPTDEAEQVEASGEKNDTQSENVETDEQEAETAEETKDTDEADKESGPSDNMPTETEGILKKSAEVMGQINGMTIKGDIKSTIDMMGVSDKETSEITGAMSYNPFSQHLKIHTVSEMDGATDSEIYLTEEAMYMSDSENGDWLSISMQQAGAYGDMSAMITEKQMNFFADQYESFKLSEDNENYILSLTGSGEEFKAVVFGALKDLSGEEGYEKFTSMFSAISGTYQFTISKDTFYMVDMKMDLDQTMDIGMGEIHTIEQIHYKYSDFNKVEAVTVPTEVTENAKSLSDLGGNMGK